VCVCVCVRERESERERVCLCLCVCEREKEREQRMALQAWTDCQLAAKGRFSLESWREHGPLNALTLNFSFLSLVKGCISVVLGGVVCNNSFNRTLGN